MKLEEIYAAYFKFEFCDPPEKPEAEKKFNALMQEACVQTGKPLYVLQPAILKCYRKYRAERLRNEMPLVPAPSRGK